MSEGMITFDAYLVLMSTFDADGFLSVGYDALGEDDSGVQPAPVKFPLGLFGRPLDPVRDASGRPDPAQSCEVLVGTEGGQTHGLLWGDPRITANLPQSKKGDIGLANYTGQFLRLGVDGFVSLFTTDDGTPNGQSVYAEVGPTGFRRFGASFVDEKLDATGWHLRFPFGRVDFGFLGGLPDPVASISGQFRIQSPWTSLESSIISLGPKGAAQQPIALGTAAQAVFAQIATALTDAGLALTAAATALSGITPGAGAPVAAAVVTLTNAIAALAPLVELVPSASTTAS